MLVQLEQLRVGPHIRAVGRDIDGNIAHNLNVLAVGIGLQLHPLLIELELQVFLELYVKIQLPVVVVDGETPVHPDVLGPLAERHIVKVAFQRHKQGKVIQPPGVVPAEGLIRRILGNIAALIGLVQQVQPVFAELVKIHLGRIAAKVHGVALPAGQNALLNQGVKADHVGIPGESRIGLIGGIIGRAVGRRAQGQNLPIALTGLFQPVYEIIRRPVKAADAVPGRQAGDGQKDTCISVHNGNSSFFQNRAGEPAQAASASGKQNLETFLFHVSIVRFPGFVNNLCASIRKLTKLPNSGSCFCRKLSFSSDSPGILFCGIP